MAKNTHVAKSFRSFPLVLSAKHVLNVLISLPWADAIRNDVKNTKKACLMVMKFALDESKKIINSGFSLSSHEQPAHRQGQQDRDPHQDAGAHAQHLHGVDQAGVLFGQVGQGFGHAFLKLILGGWGLGGRSVQQFASGT
jgi:hypothetical protein